MKVRIKKLKIKKFSRVCLPQWMIDILLIICLLSFNSIDLAVSYKDDAKTKMGDPNPEDIKYLESSNPKPMRTICKDRSIQLHKRFVECALWEKKKAKGELK
jgi:hypothetical protein